MSMSTAPRLRRAKHPMPASVRSALLEHGLMDAYEARLDATRQKRLQQMLDELRDGSSYMNMPWRPRAAPRQ